MKKTCSPLGKITIERNPKNIIKIKWSFSDQPVPVSIYSSKSAYSTEKRLIIDNITENEYIIETQDQPVVEYYYLKTGNSSGIWVGERRIPMEGTVNFRDLGGYRSRNGVRVKWGLIFRGDSLQRATDNDLDIVKGLNIGEVYDFRRDEEVEKGPDRFPEDLELEYNHVPVIHGEFNFMAALERLKKNENDRIKKETIIKGYLDNTINFATTWGTIINRLAAEECPPLYFHCTAGKDRTGICAALILAALEIPRETIIEDYLLSNPYIAEVWERVEQMISDQGIDPESLSPFFSAPKYAIEAVLAHLDQEYGGARGFLTRMAGVNSSTMKALKQRIME